MTVFKLPAGRTVTMPGGEVLKVPAGTKVATGPGWNYNPGQAAWQLDAQAYQKAAALSPAVRDWFVSDMIASDVYEKTYPAWADRVISRGNARGEAMTVGWIKPGVYDALRGRGLASETPAIAMTDDKILHMVRDKKRGALSADDIRNIAAAIRDPEAVLLDRKRDVLFVFDGGDKKNKIVVGLDYMLRNRWTVNMVKTSGKVPLSALQDRKIYEVLSGELK